MTERDEHLDVIRRNDPERAARIAAVDPPPLPCTCPPGTPVIGVSSLEWAEPKEMCVRCSRFR